MTGDASPAPIATNADVDLAHFAPLTARRVLYAGEGFESFAAAYRRRNPTAALKALSPDEARASLADRFDLAVVGQNASLADLLANDVLENRGVLLIAGREAAAAPPSELEAADFAVVKTRVSNDLPVWVAQRAAVAARPRTHVELWAFSPRLMDIRTRLPMRQLDTDPAVDAFPRTAPFELPSLPPSTPRVVILQRPGAYTMDVWCGWLSVALAQGWLPVLETDDHPELMAGNEGNPSIEHVWDMAKSIPAVQTSTPRLAEAFLAHNPEVRAFPNAVFDLPPFPEGDRPRRVFYGAISRGPFAVEVAQSLSLVVRQFPDTEFVVVGDRAVFDALPTRRKRYENFLPYERYLDLMRTCSVTLSPLVGGAAHEAKSDAKFLDAAQSGALFIASPVVYSDVVRHGENGLIARSREQWAPLLANALRNQAKRREMARCAWQEVRDGRMFAGQIADRRDWYFDLWTRREALERQVCDRVPGLAEAIRHFRAQTDRG